MARVRRRDGVAGEQRGAVQDDDTRDEKVYAESDVGMKDIDLILAIDPSTTKVGWCYVQTDGTYLNSSSVDLGKLAKGKLPWPPWSDCVTPLSDADSLGLAWDRLWAFSLWVRGMARSYLIDGTLYRVAIVAVEEPAVSKGNLDTDRKMGAAMGIVYAGAASLEIGVIRIKPSQVKATGYSKKNAQSMRDAALLAGKDKVSKDEADAIGVAMAAVKKLRERGWV